MVRNERVQIWVHKDLHKALKLKAAEDDTNILKASKDLAKMCEIAPKKKVSLYDPFKFGK